MQRKLISVAALATLLPAVTALAAVPTVTDTTRSTADAIHADPAMQHLFKDLMTQEAQDWRFANHMEIVRIISPSRQELRRQAEITRRMTEEWGFKPENIMSRTDGNMPGAGVQTVDGKPVYNVCVRIPGTYSSQKDAVNYKGQFPKVLMEGHIDTVNPPNLPSADKPYAPIKLQAASVPIVKTRAELAAIRDELHFDSHGKLIKDAMYEKAYKRFKNLEDAKANGGMRFYIPGFNDAMINTTAVMQAAVMMNKHNIKPVYDIWVCGTAGEEGKGNLAGMKQLFGYSQEAGKANNALNFVANFSADCTPPASGNVNYSGSKRFEIKYTEAENSKASALMAMSRAIEAIGNLKTPYDFDKKQERTTYTVGLARCTPAGKDGRSRECSLSVDMRSLDNKALTDIRNQIEPQFKKALDAENAAHGLKADDAKAVKMQLVWYGDRPASKRTEYNDPVIQSYWYTAEKLNIDKRKELDMVAGSKNDNVAAAIGVPTINFNVGTNAGGDGDHTWYEWGIPGDGKAESTRIYRLILMGLMNAGFNTSDGKVVEPLVKPMGSRTTDEIFK